MQLSLEVESESQKMVKTEVELQSLLQSIEYTSSCMEEFEELVIETRLKMEELKKFGTWTLQFVFSPIFLSYIVFWGEGWSQF